MAKYKIKVIAHQLNANKVAKYGEIVDESELKYNVNELLKQGFIEKVESKKEVNDIDVKDAKEVKSKGNKK